MMRVGTAKYSRKSIFGDVLSVGDYAQWDCTEGDAI